jgi:hypothetical protein
MSFDFDAAVRAPFRMQPGLRRLEAGAPQLTLLKPGDAARCEKLSVLTHDWQRALLCEPGFDVAPALDALAAQADLEHPGWRAHVDADAQAQACVRDLPAEWRPAARLCLAFAEDFAVIDGESTRIPWLAVCLPSHWAPEEKIGRPFAQVHAPVADNALLVAASASLASLVTGDERWERFVWTITRQPTLDAHPRRVPHSHWQGAATPDELAAAAFFRTERQTFIPMPARRQAVFTIHVETRPLASAIADGAQAHALHDALASMSPAVLAYRGLAEARDPLLAWLARNAA